MKFNIDDFIHRTLIFYLSHANTDKNMHDNDINLVFNIKKQQL